MRLLIIILTFTTFNLTLPGQNLVLNPGFENYDSLPCDFIDTSAQFSGMLHNWTVPNFTTPDICSPLISPGCNYGNPFSFNSGGLQTPRTGNIMVGMVCQIGSYNEYIQVPLSAPLVAGISYQAEMYVSLAAKSNFANNDIGMYFSDTLISDVNFLSTNFSPQVRDTNIITDTLNWVLISGCFTATTAAEYLIIGHFISQCLNSSLVTGPWPFAYYFFDDISVTQISSCNTGQLNCTVGIQETEAENSFTIYPNPFTEQTILKTKQNLTAGVIEVYNCFGQKIKKVYNISGNTFTFNRDNLPGGIYFVCIIQNEKLIAAEKMMIVD